MSESEAEDLTVGTGSDPFPEISQRRRRGVRVTSAAAIALGLVLSGGAAAGATTTSSSGSSQAGTQSNRPPFGGPRPAAVGTVESIGTGTFTVAALDDTSVTVDVGSTTTYFDPSVSSPTIADVKVGEHVAVFGTESSGTVIATLVAIGNPPPGRGDPGGTAGSRLGGPGGWAGGPPRTAGANTP